MKIVIQKSTGKFCGSCSSSTDETLINQAAQDYGISENDLEVQEKTEIEFQAILDAQSKPVLPPSTDDALASLTIMLMEKGVI